MNFSTVGEVIVWVLGVIASLGVGTASFFVIRFIKNRDKAEGAIVGQIAELAGSISLQDKEMALQAKEIEFNNRRDEIREKSMQAGSQKMTKHSTDIQRLKDEKLEKREFDNFKKENKQAHDKIEKSISQTHEAIQDLKIGFEGVKQKMTASISVIKRVSDQIDVQNGMNGHRKSTIPDEEGF